MNLSLQIPIQDIENKVNGALKDTLFDDYIDEDKDFKVTVTKRKSFKLKAELNTVFVEAPLRAELQIGMKTLRSLFKGLVKTIEAIDVDISIQYEIKPDVNVQWKLVPRIQGRCLWENTPSLEIAGMKFNLVSTLQWIIDDQIRKVSKYIDKYLREELRIEQYVKMGWNIVQTPMQIEEDYKIWIHFNPNTTPIYATPIQCQGGYLNAVVSVPMFPEVFIGTEPEKPVLLPLPNFEPAAKLPERSDIHISAEVRFHTLKVLLEGRSFHTQNEWLKQVTIQKADFSQDQELLVANLSLLADLKLLGETEIDLTVKLDVIAHDHNKIEFQPFDVKLRSESLAVSTYWWLNHKSLIASVKQMLEQTLTEHLGIQTKNLQKILDKRQINQYINLDVKIHAAQIKELHIFSDKLKLILDAFIQPTLGIGNF